MSWLESNTEALKSSIKNITDHPTMSDLQKEKQVLIVMYKAINSRLSDIEKELHNN